MRSCMEGAKLWADVGRAGRVQNVPRDRAGIDGVEQDPVDHAIGLPVRSAVRMCKDGGLERRDALVPCMAPALEVVRERDSDEHVDECSRAEATADRNLQRRSVKTVPKIIGERVIRVTSWCGGM